MLLIFEQIKTIINALVQRMKDFRGNWDQNDPSADDYIKNRPFYSVPRDEIVLDEVSLTVSGDYCKFEEKFGLVPGQEYTVIFNGSEYTCIAWYNGSEVILGNGNIYGGIGGENVPFSIDNYVEGEAYLNVSEGGDYTISISTKVESIVQIDPKFIPDSVKPVQPDWDQNDPNGRGYVYSRTHWIDDNGNYHKLDEGYLPSRVVEHVDNKENPHGVTPAQIGAAAAADIPAVVNVPGSVETSYRSSWIKFSDAYEYNSGACYDKTQGIMIILGQSGSVLVSKDEGRTFTEKQDVTSSGLNSAVFGNGKFVAVGSKNVLAYSEDGGDTWTAGRVITSPFTTPGGTTVSSVNDISWSSVLYGNGVFVALSSSHSISAYSYDGITWTVSADINVLTYYQNLMVASYGNGKFICYGSSEVHVSSDGISWTSHQFDGRVAGACPGPDGTFLVLLGNGHLFVSTDEGDSWVRDTACTLKVYTSSKYDGIFYADGICIVGHQSSSGSPSNFSYSFDGGVSWSMYPYTVFGGHNCLEYLGDDVFLCYNGSHVQEIIISRPHEEYRKGDENVIIPYASLDLPPYTSDDEGKVLGIVNGALAWVPIQSQSYPNAEEVSF